MRKTQILISDEQMRRLRELAARRGVSVAQIVREALDEALNRSILRDASEARRKAAAAAGRFRSGCRDVARRHDDYLSEAFR